MSNSRFAERGKNLIIVPDTCRALDEWAYEKGVKISFIRPGQRESTRRVPEYKLVFELGARLDYYRILEKRTVLQSGRMVHWADRYPMNLRN